MKSCGRARDLFGAFWDDEVTQAEREWLEGHFASCPACHAEYEQLAHTLEAVAAMPREEAAPGLAARALAAARRASPAPDILYVRETPRWVPATAAAAALLLVVASVAPWLGTLSARRSGPVPEARLVAVKTGGVGQDRDTTPAVSGVVAAAVVDSLFDHNADVDFVLDPVNLRNGRAQTSARLPEGVQGEHTVITF